MNSQSSMAGSKGNAADPVTRSGHVVSAILLFVPAAVATWITVYDRGGWADQVLAGAPVLGLTAVIWWAGGIGLLTRSSVGLWLGRLGAAALLLLGAYLAWYIAADQAPGTATWGRTLTYMMIAPETAYLVGAGIGVLVALRPRADHHAAAGRVTDGPRKP